jgi:hypothetical protein
MIEYGDSSSDKRSIEEQLRRHDSTFVDHGLDFIKFMIPENLFRRSYLESIVRGIPWYEYFAQSVAFTRMVWTADGVRCKSQDKLIGSFFKDIIPVAFTTDTKKDGIRSTTVIVGEDFFIHAETRYYLGDLQNMIGNGFAPVSVVAAVALRSMINFSDIMDRTEYIGTDRTFEIIKDGVVTYSQFYPDVLRT